MTASIGSINVGEPAAANNLVNNDISEKIKNSAERICSAIEKVEKTAAATVGTLHARAAVIQHEVSKVGGDIEDDRNDATATYNDFKSHNIIGGLSDLQKSWNDLEKTWYDFDTVTAELSNDISKISTSSEE